jgi:hypothetical protein
MEMQSGRYHLLILTNEQGAPFRVFIILAARPAGPGQWYIRKKVQDAHDDLLSYVWEKEARHKE